MGKFHKFLTELSPHHTTVAGYYCFIFALYLDGFHASDFEEIERAYDFWHVHLLVSSFIGSACIIAVMQSIY